MKFTVSALISGLVALAAAAPAPSTYVVHEKRERQLDKWTRRDAKLNRDAVVPVSIGLTQRNLKNGHDFLMDVSKPGSPNYGKHWSMEKVCAISHNRLQNLTRLDQRDILSIDRDHQLRQVMACREWD